MPGSGRTFASSGDAPAWPVSASPGLWEMPASDVQVEFREEDRGKQYAGLT